MTTQRQKAAVHFCERLLKVPFEGDIENCKQVSNYLSMYLEDAKWMMEEIACEFEAYVNDLD